MPAYVPPHMRNQAGGASAEANRGDDDRPSKSRGKGDDRGDRGDGGDRGDRGDRGNRDSDRADNRGNNDRGGGNGRASAMQATGGGGDWRKRDGRRRGANEKTELEVFGEIKERSTAGIDFDNYDAIPVQITGTDVDHFKPISRFSEAKLNDALFDNLRRCGYDRPTPVQKYSIPIVAAGRDLMACAQTGSGKTCAFMVPCLESLLRSGPPNAPNSRSRPKPMPCGLVLAPTRELALQIHVESLKFAFDTGIGSALVYGGADMREQRQQLESSCDILIATPGRLTDMWERGNMSLELVQFFILDEADRMLDMGFEPQVRKIVEETNMGRYSAFGRQSMMFSATFAGEVQHMAQDFLKDYVFITVGRVGAASELVTQHVVYAGEYEQKVRALEKAVKDYLPKDGLAVIFVATKRDADGLEMKLHESGTSVACIHGDRSQKDREEALHAFKSGANPVLVATDVAARGLDIKNVALVVNFDMPNQLDDYVHRIGRTGRAGKKGVAVAFINERVNYLPDLEHLLVEAKQDLPQWFNELTRQAARRGPPKFGGKQKFGGQDLRVTEGLGADKAGGAAGVTKPSFRSGAPERPAGSWGNTGADDGW
mmetsp:Transcript_44601/g.126164  ORF Transcript_44601/g.126164 Transcript_44601/m.126164 type:complete len:600 (+) Transcript_44601:81-1880(+)